jgi:DNA-directed RNA polymerase specialized sigma24 family protein
MENTPNCNDLLRRCKANDNAAREQLFGHLHVRLRTILKYRLRGWPTEELDDILQDTLVVVSERLSQLESNPDHFALEVMRNKIGNRIARRRRVFLPTDPTGGGEEPDSDRNDKLLITVESTDDNYSGVEYRETADAIRKAIPQLSTLCQALFTALLENRSVAETWELFSITQRDLSRSTFDKRLFDCRRKLRQLVPRTA